jgi:hypothetical protein
MKIKSTHLIIYSELTRIISRITYCFSMQHSSERFFGNPAKRVLQFSHAGLWWAGNGTSLSELAGNNYLIGVLEHWSDQNLGFQVSVFRFQLLPLIFLFPDTRNLTPILKYSSKSWALQF